MPGQSRIDKPGVLHHIFFIYHGAEVENVPIRSQQSVGGLLWRSWGLVLKRVETHKNMGVFVPSPSAMVGIKTKIYCPCAFGGLA